jgi:PAS domain S-box-containing protein
MSIEFTDADTQELNILVALSALFRTLDVPNVLDSVLRLTMQMTQAQDGSIVLFRDGRVDWPHAVLHHEQDYHTLRNTINRVLDQGVLGWVKTHQVALLIDDTTQDQRWAPSSPQKREVKSVLSVPLLYDDDLMAVITLSHPGKAHFTERHVNLMRVIANQAVIAIYNARLFEQLQAQQQRFQRVMSAFPDKTLVMDHVGRILMVNDAMLSLLGDKPRSAVIGERLTDMPDRDDSLDKICEVLLDLLDHPEDDQQERLFDVASRQQERDYQVTMSSWKGTDEKPGGFVLVMHDITRLQDLHRFKDEMLRIASHDLRSPLALIIGYADMISLDLEENSPFNLHIDAILRSANRMDRLLEDLLRIEQIRSTPLELHEWVHPLDIVNQVMQHLQPQADRKQIKLGAQLNLEFADTFILANPILIRQTMENLVGNALKYTPPGGNVAVIARFDFDKHRFHFTVADDGIGIPEDKLPFVFESFYRVNQPDTRGIQGTGLGLSLVKNVIQQHQGDVWVTSEENKGSRFGFWLPLTDAVPAS